MAKLHELLAVEGELERNINSYTNSCDNLFQTPHVFNSSERRYETIVENEAPQPTVYVPMERILDDVIQEWRSRYEDFINVSVNKEYTNREAVADVIVDGNILLKDVPSTALLNLENKLKHIKDFLLKLPTLKSAVDWEKDDNLSTDKYTIFKSKYPEIKNRTVKTFAHKVLVEATKEHPAQIEKWEELSVVGRYIADSWSSAIKPGKKSEYIRRCETLIYELKRARQRANEIKATDHKISGRIFDYIFSH